MSRILLFSFLATVILGMNGCYYDNEEVLYPNSFCDTVNVTYGDEISRIIQSNCATPGCHVAGGDGDGDFNNFAEVSAKVADGRLLRSVKRESGVFPMPAAGPLRDCEVRQIELWIASGAAEN